MLKGWVVLSPLSCYTSVTEPCIKELDFLSHREWSVETF